MHGIETGREAGDAVGEKKLCSGASVIEGDSWRIAVTLELGCAGRKNSLRGRMNK